MLEISKSAAAMLDGDIMERLQKGDEDSEPYQRELSILRTFQEQVELRYIYGIRDMGDGTFTFTIDPAVSDPGEFGEPIQYTDALYGASLGTPSVDATPYEDRWGRFYSAYSPIFNSKGNVAGIVAVDVDADWYDKQLGRHIHTILIACVIALIAGGMVVFLITSKIRKRLRELNAETRILAEEVEELSGELKIASGNWYGDIEREKNDSAHSTATDYFEELGEKLKFVQKELHQYIKYAHSLAYLDALTGVGNRNAYADVEKRLNKKIEENNADFSIAMFDINGLKNVNDHFSHEIGDRMIVSVANILKKIVKKEDLFRIGGDEFIAVLGNVSRKRLDEIFGEIDRTIAESNLERNKKNEISISISKGSATYRSGEYREVKDVIRSADEAMYTDKENYYRQHGERRRKQIAREDA
ncbi:MAG: diguanylate cyclase [Treponema sp.]|nr:diguanylate cyclase [Treponema sp.]